MGAESPIDPAVAILRRGSGHRRRHLGAERPSRRGGKRRVRGTGEAPEMAFDARMVRRHVPALAGQLPAVHGRLRRDGLRD